MNTDKILDKLRKECFKCGVLAIGEHCDIETCDIYKETKQAIETEKNQVVILENMKAQVLVLEKVANDKEVKNGERTHLGIIREELNKLREKLYKV